MFHFSQRLPLNLSAFLLASILGHSSSGMPGLAVPGPQQESSNAWVETQMLVGSSLGTGDLAGQSVAVVGDWGFVGAPLADGRVPGTGVVYVYRNRNGSWVEQQLLFAEDGEFLDTFGNALDFDGLTLVVSGGGAGQFGAAYVFVFNGALWEMQAKLELPDPELTGGFGNSVAVSGDVVLIGASNSRFAQPANILCSSGSVHVFRRRGEEWRAGQTLLAANASCSDAFGYSLALDGRTALIGSFNSSAGVPGSGSVHVFVESDGIWAEQQVLASKTSFRGDGFGSSIDLEAGLAVVGAALDNPACPSNPVCFSGAAYVFGLTGGSWVQVQRFYPQDIAQGDEFGFSAALSGGTIVVGSVHGSSGVPDSGAAYVYRKVGGTWVEEQKLLYRNSSSLDAFGISVSVDRDTAWIGSRQDDTAGINAGAAYVFERSTAAVATRNADPNPGSYTASPPLLGALWSAHVDLSQTGHSFARILGTTSPSMRALPGGQVLLLSGAQIARLPAMPGPLASWSASIPSDPSLVGLTVYTQAMHFGGVEPFALSNAQDLLLGY